MRRWDQTLARLIRVLIACLVLSFAAPASALVVEPVRDLSAWLARDRVATPASVADPSAPASPAARELAGLTAERAAERRAPFPPPPAPRAVADQRYLYLDLQTLRC
jgi:hypothetical protein